MVSAWKCFSSHQLILLPKGLVFPISTKQVLRQTWLTNKQQTCTKRSLIKPYKLCEGILSLFNLEMMENHLLTFKISSSKHCSTLTRVFALHSRKRHPYCLAKSIPSFFETTLSVSCKRCYWLKFGVCFLFFFVCCEDVGVGFDSSHVYKDRIVTRDIARAAPIIYWHTRKLMSKLSVQYIIVFPRKTYLVNLVANKHLDAFWISCVQINLLCPYFRKIRERFSTCHIIYCQISKTQKSMSQICWK